MSNLYIVTVKQPTDTRWLSYEAAVGSLRKCLPSVKLVCEEEANEGDATALGLATQITKPNFIAMLLFMSDVLTLLANLSQSLQVATLNLLCVETHVQDTIEALKMLESDVFSGGYMSTLDDSLESMQVADTVNRKSIEAIAKKIYIYLVYFLISKTVFLRFISFHYLGTSILAMLKKLPCFQC